MERRNGLGIEEREVGEEARERGVVARDSQACSALPSGARHRKKRQQKAGHGRSGLSA
jgi:hypothetical protein